MTSSNSRVGRPAGQFSYHKLCLLKYLQDFQSANGRPFSGSNADLSQAVSDSLGASQRQIARYLKDLKAETIDGGVPRIDVYYQRRGSSSTRIIVVNDMKPLNLF